MSLSAHSSYSHVFEIGDLSKNESVDFLMNKLDLEEKDKIDSVNANKIYELVGGNIMELKFVAERFIKRETLEGKNVFDVFNYIT